MDQRDGSLFLADDALLDKVLRKVTKNGIGLLVGCWLVNWLLLVGWLVGWLVASSFVYLYISL